jgi:hypothetical protein
MTNFVIFYWFMCLKWLDFRAILNFGLCVRHTAKGAAKGGGITLHLGGGFPAD